jgi:Sulfite oxidase and related enzymes
MSQQSPTPILDQPVARERFWRGALAGLLAGIITSICIQLLSFTVGSISLAETLGSAIVQTLPLPIFSFFHDTLGADAKHDLLYIVLLGQCLIFALFGGLCNLIVHLYDKRRPHNLYSQQDELPYGVGIIFAALLWLFSGFIFLPLTGAGIFGGALVLGIFNTLLSLAISALIFGLFFIAVQNWLAWRHWLKVSTPHEQQTADSITHVTQRRTFLRNGLLVAGLSAFGLAAWRFISTGLPGGGGTLPSGDVQAKLLQSYQSKISPPPVPNYGQLQKLSQQSTYITTNSDYYTVSKNLGSDPSVNATTWQMMIDGLVQHPYKLSYQQLSALPRIQQYESMMCISNEVGGDYMSNAHWEGVPLKDLLQKAGPITPGATKVVLHAADDYSDSIHLAKALEPTTLVALRMNGTDLPTAHGFPARLLVPGIYGMKHVKWITHIEIVNTDYQGYWQQNGWSDPAPLKMTSRIDTPTAGTTINAGKPTYIAGVAFSGNKGISQVDVSLDGGQSWQMATLQRPLSALTWVLWQLPWQPQSGTYTIIVRAIDLQGNVQDPHQAPPLPDGSSGYHTVNIDVA